jgi:hypothetical protein
MLAALGFVLLIVPNVNAEPSLNLQPLQYQDSLQKGERKKAYVDVTNTSGEAANVQFYVEGFRQIDDKGNLSFYNDEQLRNGILLDLSEVEIPAQKTVRLFFVVDGSKLPKGDVFAVIFAQVKVLERTATPTVRLGTLISLVNETPGARRAIIDDVRIPFFQFSDRLRGEYTVKNNAGANTTGGYYPDVTVAIDPFHVQYAQKAKLIFAGKSRVSSFSIEDNRLGLYKISVSHQGSKREQWVFMATGPWRVRLIISALAVLIVVAGVYVWRRLRAAEM